MLPVTTLQKSSVALPDQHREGLPHSYKRLVAERCGHSVRDVAKIVTETLSSPKAEEAVVRVRFAGVNGGCETFRAQGAHAFAGNKAKERFNLGAEVSGEVAAVGGSVHALQPGAAVTCLGGGGFSEYVTVPARSCYPVAMATAEAATLAVSGLTAAGALWVGMRYMLPATHASGLQETASIQQGDVVLVTAAAGATGHIAVQLAVQAGCHVVAVCGGRRKVQALQQLRLAPHRVIDHRSEDVARVLRDECPPIDVAYEGVGGDLREAVLDRLAPKGRLLAVGYISEYPHAANGSQHRPRQGMPSNEDLMWQGQTVELGQQKVYGSVWPKDAAALQRAKARLYDMHRAGDLEVWVDGTHNFRGVEDVNDAMDFMLSGQALGKVVVEMNGA